MQSFWFFDVGAGTLLESEFQAEYIMLNSQCIAQYLLVMVEHILKFASPQSLTHTSFDFL